MHDVKVGREDGFPGFGQVLMSQQYRRLLESHANTAAMLYQAVVAKRSGALARDVRVHTRVGGLANDRWVAQLIVGEQIDYGASHEFGTAAKNHENRAKDLDKVLQMLREYS